NRPLLIAMCVMRDNVLEMPDFVHYCNSIGANICFHKVWTPLQHAVYNLPAETLHNIYNLLTQQPPLPSETPLQRSNKAHYEYYLSVIKGWMQDADTHTANLEGMMNQSSAELVDYALNRLQAYIMRETMLEEDKNGLIAICSNKLKQVVAKWPESKQKRAMLIKLCLIKESEILIALKTQSVEKLYEMSLTTTEYNES
ncbi:MAG TPA: hypothetical protein VK174_10775, partial [Chitinophagales bacterium]|nr:hypothetical protein [Chitinophagales bacterium]